MEQTLDTHATPWHIDAAAPAYAIRRRFQIRRLFLNDFALNYALELLLDVVRLLSAVVLHRTTQV